jgi:hypothetical protein
MSDDYEPDRRGYSLKDICYRLDNIEAAVEANHTDLSGVVWVALIWLALFAWLPDMWHSKLRYSMWYGVDYDQVTIEKKPADCNFFHAPLGDKDCHYDPQVNVVKVDNSNAWGGQSISYDDGKTWIHTAKSQNGDRIVSNDGGKTWSTAFVPSFTKPGVVVTWGKKDED